MLLDRGEVGPATLRDLLKVTSAHADYAKLAWASALVMGPGTVEDKLAVYRDAGITPLFGGTLFEYAFLQNKVELLCDFVRDHKICIEISDGIVDVPRPDKLRWIETFAKHVQVFSEVGGKLASKKLDWKAAIAEELAAGAYKVVIEGREIGAAGGDTSVQFVDMICAAAEPKQLVFEALERKQQVALVQHLGQNVNLGNIPVTELMAVECYRMGLKDRTMMQMWKGATR
ncbi:MAG: Phosphosulfolactate synthase [Myxococcales bacterium]|nr:Phosphosulfolactate synthase [Myxococcales bacterium]